MNSVKIEAILKEQGRTKLWLQAQMVIHNRQTFYRLIHGINKRSRGEDEKILAGVLKVKVKDIK